MHEKTMGSLFSGSGGFELAGSIYGITPIWASEIEPLPILVTRKNFPETKHYGDINYINGGKIEPVTIITGGSPCQDMSIAGTRAGLDGSRSSLFREQIRIVKEMRNADIKAGRTGKHIRPRYMVWENVPGAFSSNKGKDFQSVLEEIAKIADSAANVPLPPKGKWQTAGCIMGDTYSIAWRTLDAQYWGVPQRRKRIYLVADFGGDTAPKILFEREGLCRDFKEGREAWQEPSGCSTNSTDATGKKDVQCYDISDRRRVMNPSGDVSPTLTTKMDTGGNNVSIVFEPGSASRVGGHIYTDGKTGTIRANARDNQQAIVLENHPQDSRVTISDDNIVPTLTEKMGTGGGNVPMILDKEPVPITMQLRSGCEGGGKGPSAVSHEVLEESEWEYIIRRLTPLECCRLQGFPDDWVEGIEIMDPKPSTVREYMIYWAEWWRLIGKNDGIQLPKDAKQVTRWLLDPLSDSAVYRMWGNGIALPNAMFVMEGIALIIDEENEREERQGQEER